MVKTRTEDSRKWSKKETILWETEHSLDTDKSSLNLPGGESRKQIHLFMGNLENIHIHEGGGKRLSVCNCVCRTCMDVSPDITVTFQSLWGRGEARAALQWTLWNYLPDCNVNTQWQQLYVIISQWQNRGGCWSGVERSSG